jgi:uncharacterized protein with GYD domain
MPTYIVLSKWTPQGLQNIKQSPTRLDAARKEYEAAGVKWKDFYMVTGQYDMVAIVDAPDDVTLAKSDSQLNFARKHHNPDLPSLYRAGVSADRWRTGLRAGRDTDLWQGLALVSNNAYPLTPAG